MHALIIHAHPEPASFNASLTAAAAGTIREAGYTVEISDLYADGFNPVAGRHDFVSAADPDRFHYQTEQLHAARNDGFSAEVAREQDRLRRADLLILQFPLWWGGAPAILKGWFDRVLAYGFAYVDGARFDSGVFRGKHALICVTTGGTADRFSAGGTYGEIETILRPVQRLVLQYMGFHAHEPYVCYAAPRVDQAAREAYLDAWRSHVNAAIAAALTQPRVEARAPDMNRDWRSRG
jgi:NAD(P)H dehydrogenase (quinone)